MQFKEFVLGDQIPHCPRKSCDRVRKLRQHLVLEAVVVILRALPPRPCSVAIDLDYLRIG